MALTEGFAPTNSSDSSPTGRLLTTAEIERLLTTRPNSVDLGRARAMRARVARSRTPGALAQTQLLDAIIAAGPAADSAYAHPARGRRTTTAPSGGKDYELTESDRAWLAQLPEPGSITYNDARALAELAERTKPRSADRRLVDAKWSPVKSRHDAAAARAALTAARAPWPEVPTERVRTALRAAISAETTELNDEEVATRASTVATAIAGQRTTAHVAAAAAAQRHLEEVEAEARDRADLDGPDTA